MKDNQKLELPLWKLMVIGGMSGSVAEVITIPLDTVKVRMQVMQKEYSGFFQCIRAILRKEGFQTFFQGTTPAIMR